MLPAEQRLRRREDFTLAVRHGRRIRRRHVVVYLVARSVAGEPPRAGFIVGRVVGRAVTRNRVKRRLRQLVRERLHRLAPGSLLVVRANPPAAQARLEVLARELDHALDRLLSQQAGPVR